MRSRHPSGSPPVILLGDRSSRGRLARSAALAPYDPLYLFRHFLVGGSQHPRPCQVFLRLILQRQVVGGAGERLVVCGSAGISAAGGGAVIVPAVLVAGVVVILRIIPHSITDPTVLITPLVIFITPIPLTAVGGSPVMAVPVLRWTFWVVAHHHVQHGLPFVHHVVHAWGSGRSCRCSRRGGSTPVSSGGRCLILRDGAVEGDCDSSGCEDGATAILASAAHLGTVTTHTHACARLQPDGARPPLGRLAHVAALGERGSRLGLWERSSFVIISDPVSDDGNSDDRD